MMLTPDEISEIKQALEVYEEADDMESRQRARFVIELHAVDWITLLLNERQ